MPKSKSQMNVKYPNVKENSACHFERRGGGARNLVAQHLSVIPVYACIEEGGLLAAGRRESRTPSLHYSSIPTRSGKLSAISAFLRERRKE